MFHTTVYGINITIPFFTITWVHKQSRMISKNPDQPIDYNKAILNVFEALTRYSLFEDK